MIPAPGKQILRAEFEGADAGGGLLLLTLQPQVIGHHGRSALLERLVRQMRSHAGVWFATHEEVPRHCLAASAPG